MEQFVSENLLQIFLYDLNDLYILTLYDSNEIFLHLHESVGMRSDYLFLSLFSDYIFLLVPECALMNYLIHSLFSGNGSNGDRSSGRLWSLGTW